MFRMMEDKRISNKIVSSLLLLMLAWLMPLTTLAQNHWVPQSATYEDNMTLTGVIMINGEEQHSTALEVGAFCGEECRGSMRPVLFPPTQQYVVQMTIYGVAGDQITFKLYDHDLGEELNLQSPDAITFGSTGLGSLMNPYVLVFMPIVTISVTANPEEGGTLSGMGFYALGSTCTLVATPNVGYSFMYWTEDGNEVSTDANYSFIVTTDRNLVAHFTLPLTITAISNPVEGGMVAGMGVYDYNTSCTLTATANEGFTFSNWTKDGTVVSAAATFSFIVTESSTYVANFTDASGTGVLNGVFSIGENSHYNFSQGNLQYQASTNTWRFATNQWDCVGNNNTNISQTYSGWIDLFGWGTSGYNHGAVCYQPWSISNSYSDYYAYGVATNNLYDQTGQADWGYNAIANGGNTENGGWRTLTGSEWSYVFNTRNTESGIRYAKAQVNNVNGIILLPDNWSASNYTLNNTNTSNASFSSNNISASQWTLLENAGAVFLPAADDRNGASFYGMGWSGYYWSASSVYGAPHYMRFGGGYIDIDIGTSGYYGFSVRLVRHDENYSYEINAIPNPAEYGMVIGSGTYEEGNICTLTATANTGYAFTNWTENGEVVSTEASYSFTVTGDRELVANFALQSYSISASANPSEGGSVSGAGNYNYGSTCTVTATANTGYTFTNWTENGEVVSTEASYSFTISGDRELVASFALQSYIISASVNPSEGGNVSGAGSYDYGSTCTLMATANTGYTFTNWKENGEVVSTEAAYSFIVRGDRTLVANFSLLQQFDIAVLALPEEGGSVTGGGTYQYGQSCTLTAEANEGYAFTNWTENGEVVSIEVTYTFTVTGNRNFVGNFAVSSADNYVDLGLPSGLLWATCNIGANSPEEYGDYFAWGETTPKDVYSWSTYQYCMGSLVTLTKYCNYSGYGYEGFTDGLTTLLPEDDAAVANWGNNWRMPTQTEWNELFNNTTKTWTTRNGVYGRLFTAMNGNSLFLPAAGYWGESLSEAGACGYYWSSSLDTGDPFYAGKLGFHYGECYVSHSYRNYGHSVRAVRENLVLVTATPNPADGGEVRGGGAYAVGTTCTLTATPAEGYAFMNWTENGEVVSTEVTYSFTVTGERELVANFALQSYTISTSTNPSEGGSVTGSGTYGYGSACTVTATASEGYTFQRWTENGEVVSTEATYSFTVTGDRELVANFAHANGAGTLSGVFSVGENSHVNFSQGNLQYQASTNTWRFAENQWDYVGADNANISETYDGWIDLFGWGTSGYNHGAIGYQPWTISQDNGEYLAYGDGETNLNDQSGQADWGYNAISNGGNQENNGWRTMTQPEWDYLINGRTTASGIRYAKAIVNEVQGIILLPDDWSASIFELSNTNEPHASFNGNEIDLSQWEILENAGAVFLPSAGERISTSINYAGNSGYYWSATRTDVEGAFFTFFYWDYVGTDYGLLYDRSKGRSVRLVKDDQSNQKLSFINDDFNDGEINAGYWTATGPNVYEEEGMIKIQQNVTDNDVRLTSGYISIPGSGKILIDRKFLVHRANNYFSGGYYIAFNGDEQNYIRIAYWHEAYIGKYGIYIDAQLNGITTEIRLCDAVFDTWHNEEVLIDVTSGTLAYCIDNNLVATNEIPGLTDMPQSYFHVWFYPYGWWTGHYQNMDYIKINVTEPSYHITVSPNLEEGGAVTGAGDYSYGDVCTLTATANEGYIFTNWTENGEVVSTEATYSFIVTGNRELVANFALQSYTISASANPSEGGNVSGAGSYDYGSTCTLTATANEGYTFMYWTENDTQVSADAPYSFVVTTNRNLVAHFSLPLNITATASPTEGGTISGFGEYDYNTTCTMTATPNEGYLFLHWSRNGEVVSCNASYSFTVVEDVALEAVFIQLEGQLVGEGEATNTHLPSYSFYKYSLTQQIYTPEEIGASGFIESVSYYNAGETKTRSYDIYMVYTDKTAFDNNTDWIPVTEADRVYSGTVTMNQGEWTNIELDSVFGYDGSSNLAFVVDDNSGNYTYSPHMACRVFGTQSNQAIRVYSDNTNYDPYNSGSYNGTLLNVKNQIIVDVVPVNCTISATANPTEGGMVSGAGTYLSGSTCTLSAVANEGYTFMYWTNNDIQVSSDATYSFVVTSDCNMVAYFALPFTIATVASPLECGMTAGMGEFDYGSTCTVTATANEGYVFVNWSENGEMVSGNAVYSFTVTGNRDLVAVFDIPSAIDFVDLGLPSGTLWATYNVGAQTPESLGDYFAWGETQPKDVYDWSTYQHCMGSGLELTKYCNESYFGYNGFTDNLSVLLPEDDAAVGNWGNGWIMPTKEDWQELLDNTECTMAIRKGVRGRLFTASNGNSLFLPTSGYRQGGGIFEVGSYGCYWSSSVDFDLFPVVAWNLRFNSDTCAIYSDARGLGFSVRPVHAPWPEYLVTASVYPEEGGMVSGEGTYAEGASCTLAAMANEGYTFMYWMENSQYVSSEASYSFNVTGERNLVAVFSETNGSGLLDGTFTVGENTRVQFSKGNLLYQASTGTWRFAENQYDRMGYSNANASSTYSGWIDLYCWGTSGWNSGAQEYQPYSTSMNNEDYYTGGSSSIDLTGDYADADWAYHNAIANGGQQPGLWRCLTHEEYIYMMESRTDASQKYAYATVNGVSGLVILPDTWTLPDGLSFVPQTGSWSSNIYSAEQWIQMESAGAVFLPATGTRSGNYVFYVGSLGDYWSSTACDESTGHSMSFFNGNVYPGDNRYRYLGTSVRPVHVIQNATFSIQTSANPAEGGNIEGAGAYEEGSTCTLTAIANEGFAFVNWTENNEVVSTEPTYTFVVTADRYLVAHFIPTQQTFNLSAGWSWLSTYVEQDGIDGLGMLENGLGMDGIMIKSQYDGFVSYNEGTWLGSLNGITNEKMYLVNTSTPADVVIIGPAVNLSEHPITLNPNWNWISYPSPFEKDVNEALANLNAAEGDVLKSQSCFAIYNTIYGWYGSLNTMTPGMGYMYQSHNIEDVTFVYSEGMSRSLKRNVEVGNNHWMPTIEAYPQNMSMIAVVELNGEEVGGERYELAVFSGEECRGSVRLVYVEPLHRHVAFLSVMGEEEVDLSLALYDTQTGKAYFNPTDGLRFVANAVLGTPDSPYVARFGGMGVDENDAESIAFYPNPVRAGQLFQIEMPVECPGVRVSIVNALGTVVSTTDLYAHPATLRAPAVAGVYLLRMVTNKGVAYCRKLVVKN